MNAGEQAPAPAREVVVRWTKSRRYEMAEVGWVGGAKVCGVFRQGSRWEGRVFLVLDDRYPVEPTNDFGEAQRWCVDTVRRWFALLDQ